MFQPCAAFVLNYPSLEVGVFQPCAAMSGKKRGAAAALASDSPAAAVDTVANKAARLEVSSASPVSVSAASPAGPTQAPLPTPRSWLPPSAQKVEKPVLPASDDSEIARTPMRKLIPWVVQELSRYLKAAGFDLEGECPTRRAPLRIEKEEDKKFFSYKEAWDRENCGKSIRQSNVYEAGGNMMWFNPECWDVGEYFIPSPEASWAWVTDCAKRDFQAIEGGSKGKRIMFPVPLAGAWTRGVGELVKGYPVGMLPLGAHGYIYAYYFALFLAMDADDHERVGQLYQAATTATITVYAELDKATLTTYAIHFSEIVRHSTQVLVDSFITFSRKCLAISPTANVKELRQKKHSLQRPFSLR